MNFMAIKDRIVKWFIQNIVIPQQEIIDKPGFIVEAYNKGGTQVFLREVILPEEIIVNLEKHVVMKFGSRGAQLLYSAGKMFGYSYASRSFFPKITSASPKEFEDFVYMWIRYAEAISYGGIDYAFDRSARTITLQLRKFIICPQNGMGYFNTSGSFAGFWAYLMDDYAVECVQTKCRGRGGKICEVVAGKAGRLKAAGAKIITSKTKAAVWENEAERSMNAVRQCRFNAESFKNLLDSGFFNYENGVIAKGGRRHFLTEASALYFLEAELMKIDRQNRILFGLAFEFGKSMAGRHENNYGRFISTYLSAAGYGDVSVFEKKGRIHASSDYFPWTPYADKINFAFFRGIISGMLSGFLGKKILLKKTVCDKSQGFLRIEASE